MSLDPDDFDACEPTIGDVVRDEIRICCEYEKTHPGMTLDDRAQPGPKLPPSKASRCDTCKSVSDCRKPYLNPLTGLADLKARATMICCPDYQGEEAWETFRRRRGDL